MSGQSRQRAASGQEQLAAEGEQAGSDEEKGLLRQAAEAVGLATTKNEEAPTCKVRPVRRSRWKRRRG